MISVRDIWLNMKVLLRSARDTINTKLKDLDLTGTEGDILFHLFNVETKIGQNDLAESLDLGKPAISRTVDSLVEKGYIVREKDKEDKRAVNLVLTKKATAQRSEITSIYEDMYTQVKKGISDEEFAGLESILSRALHNLETPEVQDAD